LKQRILLIFSLIMMITVLMSLWSFYTAVSLGRRVENQYRTELFVEQLRAELSRTKEALDLFLMTQRQAAADEAERSLAALEGMTAERRRITRSREQLMVKDICFLVDQYRAHIGGSLEGRRLRDSLGYSESYAAAVTTAAYIDMYIDKVLLSNLKNRADAYRSFSAWYQRILTYNTLLMLCALVLTVLLLLLFTDRLTRPMVRLAHLADEISRGNFATEDVEVGGQDEIGKTARAFNAMKNSIGEYVRKLQEKAEVERRLSEQRVENLEMQHLLKNVEIESLRSHMNPHFLFNTLNTGLQLAIVEDAERTAEFMENLSRLFRHNVRRMRGENRVRDEVEGLRYYAELLAVRFEERYRIDLRIDESLMEMRFPPLIFQPLVENSIIHGYREEEPAGRVLVYGEHREEEAYFTVEDNGSGIPEEVIRQVLMPISYSQEDFSAGSGLGLRSVVLRLRLFFEEEGIVTIRNTGAGAHIEIRIPRDKVKHV
jgi:sensor histidine kinase YesM